jgi:hypothetical protein
MYRPYNATRVLVHSFKNESGSMSVYMFPDYPDELDLCFVYRSISGVHECSSFHIRKDNLADFIALFSGVLNGMKYSNF